MKKKPLSPSQVLLAAMLVESKGSCPIRRANTQGRHRVAQTALHSEEESRKFLRGMWEDGWRRLCEPCRRGWRTELILGAFNQFFRIDQHLTTERTGHLTAEVFARKEMTEKPGPEDALGVLWPYVDGQYVPDVPTGWVEPWEQNPRKSFEDAALRELAESIRADGVQQPIVCRLTETIGTGSLRRPVLQIVMGERRWRASCLAERPTLPVIVRVGLSDRDALRLAVAENLKRRDLNAMEEADSYRALLDAGYSQVDIAQQIGISESAISNALRLRKLPQSIRDMVTDGRLSASHARALLRFEGFEAVQTRIAELAIKRYASAKSLEKGVPFDYELQTEKLIGHPTSSPYDLRPYCNACPWGAYRKADHIGVCLRPSHIPELEREEKKEREERQKAALADVERKRREFAETARKQQEETARSQAAQSVVSALLDGQDQREREGNADVTAEQEGTGTAAEAGATGIAGGAAAAASEPVPAPVVVVSAPALTPAVVLPELSVRDLPYDEREYIRHDSPPECQSECSTCPCKVLARNYDGTGVETLCLDTKRMQSLKIKATKVKQQVRKGMFSGYAERLFDMEVTVEDVRALALLCWKKLDDLPKDVLKEIAPEIKGTALQSLLARPRYDRKTTEGYEALATLPANQIVALCTRACLLHEMQQAVTNRSDFYPDTRWYFGETATATSSAPILPEPDDSESEDTERVTTCAECGDLMPDEALHTPVAEQYEHGQLLESGVYLLPMQEGEDGCFVCAKCAAVTLIKVGATLTEKQEEPAAEVPPQADAWEDPACRMCSQRRAQVSGLCHVCLNVESARIEEAVTNL